MSDTKITKAAAAAPAKKAPAKKRAAKKATAKKAAAPKHLEGNPIDHGGLGGGMTTADLNPAYSHKE